MCVVRVHTDEGSDMNTNRRIAAIVVAIAMIPPTSVASAATTSQTITVSCDATIVKVGPTLRHNGGTISITQHTTSPTSSTVTWARSSNGNDLQGKTVSNGQTASWTGVVANDYTLRARRTSSTNCNGAFPGNGNYNWNFTFKTT